MPNRLSRAALVICTVLLAYPQAVSAQNPVVELTVRSWTPSPELVLSTGALTGVGLNSVDFVQEFGIEDKSFREFRASLGRGHKLRVSRISFHYDASATIQRTFVFQGRPFTVGAPATTDIKWDLWTFGYEWDIVSRDAGFFGVVTELKYNKLVASVTSPALATTSATDVKAPIPTVGVIGRLNLGTVASVTGEFTGFSLNRDTFEGKFTDLDLYGTLNLGRHFGVQGGYRSVDVHYLVDDDTGDLKMTGPYFGGVLRF